MIITYQPILQTLRNSNIYRKGSQKVLKENLFTYFSITSTNEETLMREITTITEQMATTEGREITKSFSF